MEILPVPKEGEKNTVTGIEGIKKAIATANDDAKSGMVQSLKKSSTTTTPNSALSNIITMACGTRTCTNETSITKIKSTSPCLKLKEEKACGDNPFCTWDQAIVQKNKYCYCNKIEKENACAKITAKNATSEAACKSCGGTFVCHTYTPGNYKIPGDPRGAKYISFSRDGTFQMSDRPRGWAGDVVYPNPNKGKCTANVEKSVYYGCWGGCQTADASTDYLCLDFSPKSPGSVCPQGYVGKSTFKSADGFAKADVTTACQQWYRDTRVAGALTSLHPPAPSVEEAVAACNDDAMCVQETKYKRQMIPVNDTSGKAPAINWCSNIGMSQVPKFGNVTLKGNNCTTDLWTEPYGLPAGLAGYGVTMAPNMVLSGSTKGKCIIKNITMGNDNLDQTNSMASTMTNHALQAVDLKNIRKALQGVAKNAAKGIDWDKFESAQSLASAVVNASEGIRQTATQKCGKSGYTAARNFIYKKCGPAWEGDGDGCSITNVNMNNTIDDSLKTCLQQVHIDTSALLSVAQKIQQLAAPGREAFPFDPALWNKVITWGGAALLAVGLGLPLIFAKKWKGVGMGGCAAGVLICVGLVVLGVYINATAPARKAKDKHTYLSYGGVQGLVKGGGNPLTPMCPDGYDFGEITTVKGKTVDGVKKLCDDGGGSAWAFVPTTLAVTSVSPLCDTATCLKAQDPKLCGAGFSKCCPGNSTPIVDESPSASPPGLNKKARLWCASCKQSTGTGYIYKQPLPQSCIQKVADNTNPSVDGLSCFPSMTWVGFKSTNNTLVDWKEVALKRLIWPSAGVLVGLVVALAVLSRVK